ncbi:UNKNOWN [Stylonychia lemnae]|uniref:Uncharacterized protein n=1 Tax=Stylonychia lemnae TaxID=5949 RepID=A0A077ZSL4_STYLE|nr:UNKNOWN [Stylonychia lemnae]|eukprot:CDW72857.1 UNKNOWN [Stylonychia lemnae]
MDSLLLGNAPPILQPTKPIMNQSYTQLKTAQNQNQNNNTPLIQIATNTQKQQQQPPLHSQKLPQQQQQLITSQSQNKTQTQDLSQPSQYQQQQQQTQIASKKTQNLISSSALQTIEEDKEEVNGTPQLEKKMPYQLGKSDGGAIKQFGDFGLGGQSTKIKGNQPTGINVEKKESFGLGGLGALNLNDQKQDEIQNDFKNISFGSKTLMKGPQDLQQRPEIKKEELKPEDKTIGQFSGISIPVKSQGQVKPKEEQKRPELNTIIARQKDQDKTGAQSKEKDQLEQKPASQNIVVFGTSTNTLRPQFNKQTSQLAPSSQPNKVFGAGTSLGQQAPGLTFSSVSGGGNITTGATSLQNTQINLRNQPWIWFTKK